MKRIIYNLKVSKKPIIERRKKIIKAQIERECSLLNLILPDVNELKSKHDAEIGNIISDFKEFKYRSKKVKVPVDRGA